MNLLTTTAVLLAAVLPRIFAVVVNPNPFTEEIVNPQLGQDFTIHWNPTTSGTVTITIYGMDENDNVSSDVYTLGDKVRNSGKFTSALSSIGPGLYYRIQISSDDDPGLVSYSNQFNFIPAADGGGGGDSDSHPTISDAPPSTTSEGIPSATSLLPTPDSTTTPAPTVPPEAKPSQSSGSSSSPTAGVTGADTTPTPTTGSSLPTLSSNPSSKGLSPGAAAGIGVGATLGILILLVIAGFFWWRRRKVRAQAGPEPEMSVQPPASGANTGWFDGKKRAQELEGSKVAVELEGRRKPAELDGTPRAELEC